MSVCSRGKPLVLKSDLTGSSSALGREKENQRRGRRNAVSSQLRKRCQLHSLRSQSCEGSPYTVHPQSMEKSWGLCSGPHGWCLCSLHCMAFCLPHSRLLPYMRPLLSLFPASEPGSIPAKRGRDQYQFPLVSLPRFPLLSLLSCRVVIC